MIFRVGQTVELIDTKEWMAARVGATAVIQSISNKYISIVWKRDSLWYQQGDGGYYPKDFRLKTMPGEQLLFSFMSDDEAK